MCLKSETLTEVRQQLDTMIASLDESGRCEFYYLEEMIKFSVEKYIAMMVKMDEKNCAYSVGAISQIITQVLIEKLEKKNPL